MIRPFLTNKGMIASNEISLKQGDGIINNEGKVPELLNNAFINVVENTARKKPLSVFGKDNVTFSTSINAILEEYKYHPSVPNIKKHSKQGKCFSFSEVTTAINTILDEYKYHLSVLNIKKHSKQGKCFSFSEMNTIDILILIKRINIKKAMGEDQVD